MKEESKFIVTEIKQEISENEKQQRIAYFLESLREMAIKQAE